MRRIAIIGRDGKFYGPDKLHLYQPHTGASATQVISDGLDYVWNPANGQRYTSKRAYYKAVRAAGGEIVGNEQQHRRETPSSPVAPDIKRAIEELSSR